MAKGNFDHRHNRRWSTKIPGPSLKGEVWRPTDISPNYQVSNLGRIKSPFTIMTPSLKKGYLMVNITLPGSEQITASLHGLVCTAFHGPKPTAAHVMLFRDGDRENCRADNLSWVTKKQLSDFRRANPDAGEVMFKLTPEQVDQVKEYIKEGLSDAEIAAAYAVSGRYVGMIRRGERLA